MIELEIRVHDNDVEKAIKLLKRLIQKEGVLGELKKRRFYEKPSERRKRQMIQARKKMLRKMAKQRRAGLL